MKNSLRRDDGTIPTVELSGQAGRLSFALLEVLPANNPGAGDLHLVVVVEAEGFVGERSVWIEAARWNQFLTQLEVLESRRQGEAEISGMSPEQFELKVRSVDRAGHMGVFGTLTRHMTAQGDRYTNHLQFGFVFCPTLLPSFLQSCQALTSNGSALTDSPDLPTATT